MIKRIIKKILKKVPLKNIIVFSSLNDFDCNSGALFKYLLEHGYDKRYIFVWRNIFNGLNKSICILLNYKVVKNRRQRIFTPKN